MGNNGSKVINIDNPQATLRQCEQLQKKNCGVYGQLHLIRYGNLQFYIKQTKFCVIPKPQHLHYIVPPRFLIIPRFTLLQEATPSSIEDILNLISEVAQLSKNERIGISHKRIGFTGKWGVVGEYEADWNYKQILLGKTQGIFLSPQQMISISEGKQSPNHDPLKSDVFAFGIMIVELIFREPLDFIFDYDRCEILLKPLLSRLNIIKQSFGELFYQLMLGMLEFEQEQRHDFSQVLEIVSQIQSQSKIHNVHIRNTSKSPIKRRKSTEKNKIIPPSSTRISQRIVTQRSSHIPQQPPLQINSRSKSPISRNLRATSHINKFQKQNNLSSNSLTPKSPLKIQQIPRSNRGYSPIIRRI